ncbi:hypothetical protein KM043_006160 [Ampulex compressa]|nr:hypothetical protein KM043_006160 [Ampulex compressa]
MSIRVEYLFYPPLMFLMRDILSHINDKERSTAASKSSWIPIEDHRPIFQRHHRIWAATTDATRHAPDGNLDYSALLGNSGCRKVRTLF